LGKGKINRLIASVFYALDVLRSLKMYYREPKCDTLILVRYLMGTAYLPKGLAQFIYGVFERFVPTSEYMFFLDASPEELLERLKRRKHKEMFETFTELVKVRKKVINLARGWYIIDTAQSIDDTFSCIEHVLDSIDN